MIESIDPSRLAAHVNGVSRREDDEATTALPLVRRLCRSLAGNDISYCHWKSNNALERSASGDNDLDLLVSRSDMARFSECLSRLGFKQALAPAHKQMPGVLDFFGYDETAGKLVHVHAHYQLVMGQDMTKNYRLPIENAYLQSAVQHGLFRVPTAEFEFVVFVIRMILKYATWDAVAGRQTTMKRSERSELAYLLARIDEAEVNAIVAKELPYIGLDLFQRCAARVQRQASRWAGIKTAQQLQAALRATARRPQAADIYLKLARRALLAVRRRRGKAAVKYYPGGGGVLIAIVGGDGAGKSTAVAALSEWLAKNYTTHCVHMGKPRWTWTTRLLRVLLKVGSVLRLYPAESNFRRTLQQTSPISPAYPWLVREICRARDRYWTYVRARRSANRGGIVIFDRFPLSQIQLMDGPLTELFLERMPSGPQRTNPFVKALIGREAHYYRQIIAPDLLIVLRVDPDIAVQRKTEEDPDAVHERSSEIWGIDWAGSGAHVIDSSQSKAEVLTTLKELIWSVM